MVVVRKETKMREMCLSQIELAARWRISPRTLERWRWIYRVEDVLAFEQQELRDLEEIKAER